MNDLIAGFLKFRETAYPERTASACRSVQQQRPRGTADWHLDGVVVSIARHRMYLWGAVDSEREVFDLLVQARRDKAAALKLLRSRGRLRQTPWHQLPITPPNVSSQYAPSGTNGAEHAPSRKGRKTALLQDFMRDWRSWNKAERATALCLAATLISGIPALFLAMILG